MKDFIILWGDDCDYGMFVVKLDQIVILIVDGFDVIVFEGIFVMCVVVMVDIDIFKFCVIDSFEVFGFCCFCVVEIEGCCGILVFCIILVVEGMVV